MSSKKVEVGFYDKPEDVGGYTGWVGTDKWILWEHVDGSVHVFLREENGGTRGNGAILNAKNVDESMYEFPPPEEKCGKKFLSIKQDEEK